MRIRPGWYATPDTAPDVRAAVRCGGSVSCGRALSFSGIWVVDEGLHVRVGPSARVHATGPRIHRRDGQSQQGMDDLPTALLMASRCMTVERAVCALDSALHLKLFSRTQARWLLATPRGRRIWQLSDGRSESGIETLARLRLRSLGLRVHVQVKIRGVGRVDLLIGDRLIIELDGDQWHSTKDQREEDRRRDSAGVALGYLVLRAGYWRVLDEWEGFEREVLAVVRRRDHLWRGRLRTSVHGFGEAEPRIPRW